MSLLAKLAREQQLPSLVERARMRLAAARIAHQCAEAIDALHRAQGSRSLFRSNRVQQVWQDIHAARLHAGNNLSRYSSQYADALLGRPVRDHLL